MKDSNNNTSTAFSLSLGTCGFILFIVFLVLKLTKVINWNWFWIWFPLWLPAAIGLTFLIIAIIIIAALRDR